MPHSSSHATFTLSLPIAHPSGPASVSTHLPKLTPTAPALDYLRWLKTLQLALGPDLWKQVDPSASAATSTAAAVQQGEDAAKGADEDATNEALKLIWLSVDGELQDELFHCRSGVEALAKVRRVRALAMAALEIADLDSVEEEDP